MIYLTADLHLGSPTVCDRHQRPFVDKEQMEAALIENWNSVVSDRDDVYILGDFCEYRGAQALSVIQEFKGRKHLVRGNQDLYLRDALFKYRSPFEDISEVLNLRLDGKWFVLSHYPMLSWAGQDKGTLLAHGHLHTKKLMLDEQKRFNGSSDALEFLDQGIILLKGALDVGVDNNGFMPVSAFDVVNRIKRGESTVLTRRFFRPVKEALCGTV